MSEIEKNELIRSKDGVILKVLEHDKTLDMYLCTDNKNKGYIEPKYIVKHSHNIIDLIEVGDYVNGYEVDEFDDEEGNLYLGIPIYDDALMDCIEEVRPLNTMKIQTILTKEQFTQNCYEVKG